MILQISLVNNLKFIIFAKEKAKPQRTEQDNDGAAEKDIAYSFFDEPWRHRKCHNELFQAHRQR